MSDTSVWDRLLAKMLASRVRSAHVRVGVIGSKGGHSSHGDGLTILDVAVIHEFGAPGAGIPERSFIRRTMTEKEAQIAKTAEKVAVKVITGKMSVERALDILGLAAATMVKRTITQGSSIPPPLKPETVAAKGSSRALVDTGQLLSSITHEVVE